MQNAQTGIMKKSGMQVNLQSGAVQQPVLLVRYYDDFFKYFVTRFSVSSVISCTVLLEDFMKSMFGVDS